MLLDIDGECYLFASGNNEGEMDTVEAAARAMCLSEGEDPDTMLGMQKAPLYGPRGYLVALPADQTFPAWGVYVPLAKTCLNAVAAPSQMMLTAGAKALQYYCDATPDKQAEAVWRAMHAVMLIERT
jgi:hypothetical protein